MKHKRSLTLAELVQAIQDSSASDDEAVAILNHMLNTGRVTFGASDTARNKRPSVPKRTA